MSALQLPVEERWLLLDALGELISDVGVEPLATWPIMLATPAFFPEAWAPGPEGLAALGRSVAWQCGLPGLTFAFEDAGLDELGGWPLASLGAEGDVCHVAIVPEALEDPEAAAGLLAQVVSEVYRERHGLTLEDDDDAHHEAQLVDVTAVFLGFGVLLANVADLSRSSGEIHGHFVEHRSSRLQATNVSPEAVCLLLAAQLVACRAGGAERQAIATQLRPNQAAAFDAALRWLDANEAELRQRVPVPTTAVRRAPVPRPLPPAPAAGAPAHALPSTLLARAQADDEARPNRGQPVFRTARSGSELVAWCFWATLIGLVAGAVLKTLWLVAVLPLVTAAAQRWVLPPVCSRCDAWLPAADLECPQCGGTIAGDIARRRDRLEAEDAYWARRGGPPPSEADLDEDEEDDEDEDEDEDAAR